MGLLTICITIMESSEEDMRGREPIYVEGMK